MNSVGPQRCIPFPMTIFPKKLSKLYMRLVHIATGTVAEILWWKYFSSSNRSIHFLGDLEVFRTPSPTFCFVVVLPSLECWKSITLQTLNLTWNWLLPSPPYQWQNIKTYFIHNLEIYISVYRSIHLKGEIPMSSFITTIS